MPLTQFFLQTPPFANLGVSGKVCRSNTNYFANADFQKT
jgi:hypothetical protein